MQRVSDASNLPVTLEFAGLLAAERLMEKLGPDEKADAVKQIIPATMPPLHLGPS